ncbi:helix-turn-helix transcriptional regulator [Streptomyces capparidis]
MFPSSAVQEARRALGQRLREIRLDAGLTSRTLARRAGWHESKCSRLEHARALPSDADIRRWTLHCGVPEQAADLIATARGIDGMYVEWRRLTRDGLRRVQQASLPLWERTRLFRVYEPGVVPGLFQTPGYASALMEAIADFHGIPNDRDSAVAARMNRQRVLHEGVRRFAVLMEESALLTRIGDAPTMAAQLERLREATRLAQVSLGILPARAGRGMWPVEGFWIFDEERVLVELVTAEVTVTQPREITLYARTFAELSKVAVYGAAARRLISAAISSFE